MTRRRPFKELEVIQGFAMKRVCDSRNGDGLYYCAKRGRKQNCRASISVSDAGIRVLHPHNHERDDDEEQVHVARSNLRALAHANPTMKPRLLIEAATRGLSSRAISLLGGNDSLRKLIQRSRVSPKALHARLDDSEPLDNSPQPSTSYDYSSLLDGIQVETEPHASSESSRLLLEGDLEQQPSTSNDFSLVSFNGPMMDFRLEDMDDLEDEEEFDYRGCLRTSVLPAGSRSFDQAGTGGSFKTKSAFETFASDLAVDSTPIDRKPTLEELLRKEATSVEDVVVLNEHSNIDAVEPWSDDLPRMSLKEVIVELINNPERRTLTNFINGEFVPAEKSMDSINPATGKAWIRIPDSDDRDVEEAVNAANQAFASWSTTSAQKRSDLLLKVAQLVEDNLDGFAQLESRDQGKPVSLAKMVDIPRCVHNFRFFATSILHNKTASTIIDEPVRALNYVKNDPVGVAGLISPWNLPLYLLSFKLAPALATGNTVVCKPSELTSVSAYVLMHAFVEAGFPPGVVNMIIGTGPSAGQHLVTHPLVPLISFTGSTVVGKKLAELGAAHNKKISLEMGGKNACIVFPSADLDKHMGTIARSCFINQGEICLCSSRIFVHDTIYEEFLRKLIAEAKKFTIGDPETNVTLGAMNSKIHFDKVSGYINRAREENGNIHCGGVVQMQGKCAEGYFIAPTIISGLSDVSSCMTDEIFGPVVCVTRFSDDEEVIRRANANPYGLSATVWSEKSSDLLNTANALRVGTVWCNTWLTRDLNMPFGGTKQSGLGREGAEESLHFFTEQKTVCVRL